MLRPATPTQWPEFVRADPGAVAPGVVAGEVDVFPAQW